MAGTVAMVAPAAAETAGSAAAEATGPVRVHFVDVGQADGVYVEMPGDVDVVVDCGRWTSPGRMRDYLISQDVDDVELMVATHPDADHIGGCDRVLEHYEVEQIVDNGMSSSTQTYGRYEDARASEVAGGATYEEADFQEWDFGGVELDVFGPVTPDSGETNNNSVVTRLDTGPIDVLLTGDIDMAAENEVVSRANALGLDLTAEILKVPHHGSAGSTSASFLDAVQPDIGIISVGGNPYGHPTPEALGRLAGAGVDVYRTDQEGHIVVEIEEGAATLNGELVVGEDTTPPELVADSRAPADGSVDVPVSAEVSATFDEAIAAGGNIDDVSVTAGGSEVPGLDVSISSSRLAIAHEPFEPETEYTVTVPAGAVTDEAGNALAEEVSWSFTTAAPDTTAPSAGELAPADGAVDASISARVSVTFDEPVRAAGALDGVTVTAGEEPLGGLDVSVSGDRLAIGHGPFEPETEYVVTVPAGAVTDEAGNPLADPVTWSFTTGTSSQVLVNPSFEDPGSNGATPSGWSPVLLANESDPYNLQAVTYNAAGEYPPPAPVPDGEFALEMFWQVGSSMGLKGVAAEQTADTFGQVDQSNVGTLSYAAVQTYYADPSVVNWAGGLAEVQLSSGDEAYMLRYFHPNSGSYTGEPQNSADGSVRYVISKPFPGNGSWISAEHDLAADVAEAFGLAQYTVDAIRVGNLQDRTGEYPFSNMTTYWDGVELENTVGDPDTTPPAVESVTPPDGSADVSLVADVSVTFDERVLPGDALDDVTITVDGADVTGVEPAVSGSTLTVAHDGLEPDTEYTGTVPAGAVTDMAGNPLESAVSWSFTTRPAPVFVDQRPLVAGEGFSIAVNDGDAWTWGTGVHGDGEPEHTRETPAAGPELSDVTAVSTGGRDSRETGHSFALTTDGTLWGWGSNGDGQLGDGGTDSPHLSPVRPDGLEGVVAVAANRPASPGTSTFSLALRDDGTVWGWGSNGSGQLGDGSTEDRGAPTRAGDLTGVVDVAAGALHSLALTEQGTVWTWGVSWFGLAGDGTSGGNRYEPVAVPGLTDVVEVDAAQMTSFALRADGTVWAWGRNNNGNIGDGGTQDALEPVQVPGLQDVVDISASRTHTLAVTSDGTVWAWGSNDHGALGDGTTEDRFAPEPIADLADITTVAAGVDYSLAVDTDGQVWAWGRNADGELGIGTTGGDRLAPVAAELDLDVGSGDACPDGYSTEETVAFGGNDSGVPNVDRGDGCTVLDVIWADKPYESNAAFVRHVRGVTDQFRDDGLITARDRTDIVRAAASSDVGNE